MTIRQTRTIGPKNLVVRKIANKYKRQRQKKEQTGGSLIGNLAIWEINLGAKAINSGLGKK